MENPDVAKHVKSKEGKNMMENIMTGL